MNDKKNDNKVIIDGVEYDFTEFEQRRVICKNCTLLNHLCIGVRHKGELYPWGSCDKFVSKYKEEENEDDSE